MRGGVGIGVLAAGSGVDCSPINANNTSAPFVPTKIPGCVLWCETDTTAHPTAVVYRSSTLLDGNMELANTTHWPGWDPANITKDTTDPHGGTRCLMMSNSGGAPVTGYVYQAGVFLASDWYTVSGWYKSSTAGVINLYCGDTTNLTLPAAATWTHFSRLMQCASGTALYLFVTQLAPGDWVRWDDLQTQPLAVSRLTDLSGAGNHPVQAVAAAQMLSVASGAGVVVRSDGIAKYLAAAPYTANQPRTRYLLVKPTVQASARTLIDGNAANSGALKHKAGSTTTQCNAGSAFDGPALADATWQIFRQTLNGASSSIAINGGTPTVGDAGAGNPGGLYLGVGGGAAAGTFAVADYAAVIDYAGAHNAATAAQVEAYLTALKARLSI